MPFSQPHADAACNFFERVLRHTADEWYGQPFLLAPWQEEGLSLLFGTVDDVGNRLIKLGYWEVPKKAGKTEWAAGLVLFMLIFDRNPGCQVYGAAAATRQAMNVYRAACKMVEQSPMLKKRLRVLRGTNRIVKRNDPDSFYAAVAADGDLSDGVNPSCVVADELHRWKTRKQLENWDVLSLGGVTRRQPLTIAITTAGVQNESPLAWRLHEKTKRIEDGVVQDPTFIGRIFGASEKDDWTAESTWIKANPSLKQRGGFLDIGRIREKYEARLSGPGVAVGLPPLLPEHLGSKGTPGDRPGPVGRFGGTVDGVRIVAEGPWGQGAAVTSRADGPLCRAALLAGVDLSMTTDLSAVALVFPCEDDGFDVLSFFWTPEGSERKRELRDGMPYRWWAEAGFIELSEGDVIDYREVKARLEWAAEVFDLREICFDPWNSRQISVPLVEQGFACVEIRQGVATLSEPSKKLLELVTAGKLRHGDHPALRWNASCLVAKETNDNLMFTKPERSRSSSRIDGVSATVNALVRAIVAGPQTAGAIEIW